MASVIIKSVGAAVGNILLPGVGGAVLGGLGGSLGNIVDGKLGLNATATGPRLENMSVQDSRYGAGIPIIYGNARVAGNIIWSTDLIETQHNATIGGKGGSQSSANAKTFTYSVHCAIGICAGPIAGINTIWADSTIIYQDGVWTSGLFDNVQIYTGDASQAPDSFMQSILGAGNVPSYRGLAYVVFDNLQLSGFGSRLPNLTFEIAANAATNNPLWLGSVDAGISLRAQSLQSGTMLPIVLQKSGTNVQTVLVGGYTRIDNTANFAVAKYNVTENVPVQMTCSASDTFLASSPPVDSSWALSPEGRFVALYIQNVSAPSHSFALYDTEAETFGALYSASMSTTSLPKQIVWLDAQHFIIDDVSGTVRGLRVFARAGTGIIDLGFTGLWGSGSATTTTAFYGAQFTPYADGLLAYNFVTNTKTLRACAIVWRNNQLSFGDIYNIATLPLSSESGKHARFVQSGKDEWTLAYGNVLNYGLMSFEPSATAAVLTRPWQTFSPNTGTGTTHFPVFFGDRLLIVQNAIYGDAYHLSEVLLASGSFTLSLNAVSVSGGLNKQDFFGALRLDGTRILFAGMGGSVYDIGQLAIIERNTKGSVAAILADILKRAGYDAGDFDVSPLTDTLIQGYVVQDAMSARSAIEPLHYYKPFDLIETAGQLKAVLRGGAAGTTVSSDEWRCAFEDKTPPPPLLITRAQEMDLPREVDIDVIDPSRNFEVNTQRARRIGTSSRSVQKLALPVVCNADTAKQIAETRLYTAWAERDLVKLSISRKWLALEPADVVDLGNGRLLRIASVQQSGGLIQLEGFYSYAASLYSEASADGGQRFLTTDNAPAHCVLYLLDLPLLHTADDQPGFYVAATAASGWKGASIYRSSDGASYTPVGALSIAATAGIATTVLAEGPSLYLDKASTVNVQMSQGNLSSCNWTDLTNGANAALLGDEIIQFQTAVLTGAGHYMLSNLLRGRRGTESAVSTHKLGENFIQLQNGAVDFIPNTLGDRNQTYDFRALSPGQSLGAVQDTVFTYGMKTLCPLSPVNIKGVRSLGTSGDLTLCWTRRARMNAEWVDYIDVPLDEPQELYEVDIMNGASLVRAFRGVTSPSVVYSAAEQTSDWGASTPPTMTVKVYQTSARYGNGEAATAII